MTTDTDLMPCHLCAYDGALMSALDDEDDRRFWFREIRCGNCGLSLKDGIAWTDYAALGKDAASDKVGQILTEAWNRRALTTAPADEAMDALVAYHRHEARHMETAMAVGDRDTADYGAMALATADAITALIEKEKTQ